jgi:putative transposase
VFIDDRSVGERVADHGIWRRGKPDSVLHHSDQRGQYTSEQFQLLMADHGVTCSMSRSGSVWESNRDSGQNDPVERFELKNGAIETFFSSFKTERTARKV